MSNTYPDPIQGANSPFAKTFPYEPMPHYPTVVLPAMTLRDYFAAAALQGFLSNAEASRAWNESDVARFCYFQADAMIKAREVKP